jgi:hypothetical protein
MNKYYRPIHNTLLDKVPTGTTKPNTKEVFGLKLYCKECEDKHGMEMPYFFSGLIGGKFGSGKN